MWWFSKKIKESAEEVKERVLGLCEDDESGIFAKPMKAQIALDELARHLLGSGYYTINSTNVQGNTEIVYDIETKYRRVNMWGSKKIKESAEEVGERILGLCYDEDKDFGIMAPPMDAQVGLDELARHLLGENWYVSVPISPEQVNTHIVYEIERKYKRLK